MLLLPQMLPAAVRRMEAGRRTAAAAVGWRGMVAEMTRKTRMHSQSPPRATMASVVPTVGTWPASPPTFTPASTIAPMPSGPGITASGNGRSDRRWNPRSLPTPPRQQRSVQRWRRMVRPMRMMEMEMEMEMEMTTMKTIERLPCTTLRKMQILPLTMMPSAMTMTMTTVMMALNLMAMKRTSRRADIFSSKARRTRLWRATPRRLLKYQIPPPRPPPPPYPGTNPSPFLSPASRSLRAKKCSPPPKKRMAMPRMSQIVPAKMETLTKKTVNKGRRNRLTKRPPPSRPPRRRSTRPTMPRRQYHPTPMTMRQWRPPLRRLQPPQRRPPMRPAWPRPPPPWTPCSAPMVDK
mmetsp:Transcript_29156/g.84771  ORF Transcript_29156/g.84771 Transcript_29156/m.84771 type:complete len:350 (-) Transcript_29156:1280-2329(-)